MKAIAAAFLLVGALLGTGTANAETGPNPTYDQRCYNPAYTHFDHYQGGKKISHKDHCKDAIMPPDWGDPTELP